MDDILERLANAVMAIKSDPKLTECFVNILSIESLTQQVRVQKLLTELKSLDAPDEVMGFVKFLGNDRIADQVLKLLSES